ncbi:MAG: GEVED domain-containing protein, partial [Angustibacter sp.]
PPLLTSNIGSTYTVPVDLGGTTSAGTVCGWIDFDRGGTFGVTGERACATFAAGATTANLTWTVPTATTSGLTYARFRVSNNATQAQSPTGLADSGEVEDYTLEIKPAVRLVKDLLPATDPGTFDLSINGTTFATGVGDAGTTGYQSVGTAAAIDAPDILVTQNVQTTAIPLTMSEAGAGGTSLGDYAASYACVNGSGASVSTTASVNIPVSVTGAGANGQAQTLTCTVTNRTKIELVNDTGTTPQDTNIIVSPLSNDIGGAGAALVPGSVKLLNPTTNTFGSTVTIAGEGTYTANANGTVTFDPLPGFLGTATPVTYQASDGTQTGTATITITVTPKVPVATPNTATTPQGVPVTTAVLGNDTPGSFPLDPTTVQLLDPADGTYKTSVTIPGQGTYTVDPATGAITFTPLPAFVGTATPITYRVEDTSGA